MFVIVLTYTAPVEEIDAALPAHLEWLTEQYDQGRFLASGKRHPRTGGVVIARRMPRPDLDAILETDPFAVGDLAKYEVIEFSATTTVPELSSLNEAV
jgi:uncharacterized protein YciI